MSGMDLFVLMDEVVSVAMIGVGWAVSASTLMSPNVQTVPSTLVEVACISLRVSSVSVVSVTTVSSLAQTTCSVTVSDTEEVISSGCDGMLLSTMSEVSDTEEVISSGCDGVLLSTMSEVSGTEEVISSGCDGVLLSTMSEVGMVSKFSLHGLWGTEISVACGDVAGVLHIRIIRHTAEKVVVVEEVFVLAYVVGTR